MLGTNDQITHNLSALTKLTLARLPTTERCLCMLLRIVLFFMLSVRCSSATRFSSACFSASRMATAMCVANFHFAMLLPAAKTISRTGRDDQPDRQRRSAGQAETISRTGRDDQPDKQRRSAGQTKTVSQTKTISRTVKDDQPDRDDQPYKQR